MRSLLGEESKACEIEPARLEEHFSVPPVSLGNDAPDWLPPAVDSRNTSSELTTPFSREEIEAQLKRLPWQSSPGPDGVPYRLWKSTPASASLLARLFTTCLLCSRLPPSWKRSTTILIYKKGDDIAS